MEIKKKFTGIMLSLAMLVSAAPPGLAVSAQAAPDDDIVLAEAAATIDPEYVTEAKTWFSSQLNDQAKSIYDLLVSKIEDLKTGNTDIDLNEATQVDEEDVKAYQKGDRTLFNDFTAAKDAFDLEHPEVWYVDYDYLSFRIGTKDGELHAYVGIGRADTYYVQPSKDREGGIADAADVGTKTAAVNEVIQAIKAEAEKGETIKEKVELAHDGVINRIAYRYENECKSKADATYIRTPYALVTHQGVCEAYSRSLQLVLNEMGIPCILLHGTQTSGTPEAHMWMAVHIPKDESSAAARVSAGDDDGYGWYIIDPTWDDPTGYDGYGQEIQDQDGKGGGENRTYCLVGRDATKNWILSGFFSNNAKEFTYPPIEQASYGSKTLVNNGADGFQITTEDSYLEDIRATKWNIRYKGMSLAEAQEKGYYMMCRMYNYHADGSISKFDNWYYIIAGLIATGNPEQPNYITEPRGTDVFYDDVWRDPQDPGENALHMVYGQGEYIEFAITTRPPDNFSTWSTPFDPMWHGYFTGTDNEVLAETGMLFNAAGSYEAPPYVKSQSPDVTRQTSNDETQHAVVEFDDSLYRPDEAGKEEHAKESNNYDQALGDDFGITVNYMGVDPKDSAKTSPHVMAQAPVYENFVATYACGGTKTLTKNDAKTKHNGSSDTIVFNENPADHQCEQENCGIVKVEYDITPSNMWADDLLMYTFRFDGVVGRRSDKIANTWSWVFAEEWGYCWYRSQGIDWNLWGQPKLMDDVNDLDLEAMKVQGVDGQEDNLKNLSDEMGVDNMNGRLMLVVEDLSNSKTEGGALEEELLKSTAANGLDEEDIAGRSIYDIDFARTCRKTVVDPGQSLRMQVGFPAGFDSSSDVVFKAYHFTRCSEWGEKNGYGNGIEGCKNINNPGHEWGDDVLSVESIPVAVTPYGLVILCDSFSPVEIVADKSEEAMALAAEGDVTSVVEVDGNGTVTYMKDGETVTANGGNGLVTIPEGGSVEFTATPEEGYEVASVLVSGTPVDDLNKLDGSDAVTFTVTNEQVSTNNAVIAVTFETKKVKEEVYGEEITPDVAAQCAHTEKTYFKYENMDELSGEEVTEGVQAREGATCTTDGYVAGIKCTECGAKLSEPTVIKKTGHTMVPDESGNPYKPATCDEEGYTGDMKCSKCSATQSGTTIKKLGHAFKDYASVIENGGYVANCMGSVKGAECRNGCGKTNYIFSPEDATGHLYTTKSQYVKNDDVTCTSPGTETAKCGYQGAAEFTLADGSTVEIPEEYRTCTDTKTRTAQGRDPLGHKKDGAWTVNSDGICTQCNQPVCKDGQHVAVVTKEKQDPTCTEVGHTASSKCEACGAVIEAEMEIPKKEHSFDSATPDPNVPDQAGKHHCSECDQWFVPENPQHHQLVDDPAKDATCTTGGLTAGQHCSQCGAITTPQTATEPLGHEWDTENPEWIWPGDLNADPSTIVATVKFKCKRADCGAEYTYTVPKESVTTNETEAATCEKPGKAHYVAVVSINFHDDPTAGNLEFSGTSTSGELTIPALGHDYVLSDNQENATEATCSKNGTEIVDCTRCDSDGVSREVPDTATGEHIYEGEGQIVQDATCTEPGTKNIFCKYGCGTVKQESIPAKGHSFSGGSCTVCGFPDPEYKKPDTEFKVDSVDKLVETLNSPQFTTGDTIILQPITGSEAGQDVYDLSTATGTQYIDENGVFTIRQGITITTKDESEGISPAAEESPVKIKGSFLIDTSSDVTIDGITFTEPAATLGACIDTADSVIVNNITVTGCTYQPESVGDDEDDNVFMLIEGALNAVVTGNNVDNARIVVKSGSAESKTGNIDMTGNTFGDGFKLEIEDDAMAPGCLINVTGSKLAASQITGPLAYVKGLVNEGDVDIEVTFAQKEGTNNQYDVYLQGYKTIGDERKPAAIVKLVAVDLKIALQKAEGGANTLAITDFEPVTNWSYEKYDGDRYLIHENGWETGGVPGYDLSSDVTGKVLLGTLTIGGYGTGTLKAEIPMNGTVQVSSNVQQRIDNNVVQSSTAKGKTDADGNVIGENVTISQATRDLAVNIAFNNPIMKDVLPDYDRMVVTVTGSNGYEEVGVVGYVQDGMSHDAYLSNRYGAVMDVKGVDGQPTGATIAKITFEDLPVGRYDVVVEGDGYMTFRKSILVEESKNPSPENIKMNIWNNVKDEATTVIEGDDQEYTVTFLAGDIVQDYTINLYDLSAAVAYFGKDDLLIGPGSTLHWVPNEEAVPNYDDYIKYDLNRDGKIDSKDIAMVLVSWDAER